MIEKLTGNFYIKKAAWNYKVMVQVHIRNDVQVMGYIHTIEIVEWRKANLDDLIKLNIYNYFDDRTKNKDVSS